MTNMFDDVQTLRHSDLMAVEGGVPAGWYSPFASISDHIICRNGYSQANMQNGSCRVDWGNVANHVAARIGNDALGAMVGWYHSFGA